MFLLLNNTLDEPLQYLDRLFFKKEGLDELTAFAWGEHALLPS